MDSLMIGISGIRGVVGRALTPELLVRFAAAFGTFMRSGKVLVGRDTRVSGVMIKHCVFAGLMSTGCSITDLDVVTTPTCALMVNELDADGAVVISGSHNPVEWNALKFMGRAGSMLNERQGRAFLDTYYQGNFRQVEWDKLREVEAFSRAGEIHKGRVLQHANVPQIRQRRLKVVLDSCNGAGSLVTPELLEELGCEVVGIHCEPNGRFPHNPEPTFVNLGDLCETVKVEGADIGFAQDADADRMAVVDENGHYLGEEYSVALAVDYVLRSRTGPVVINLSTTRAVDDLAAKYGCPVYRTAVGEANVSEKMREVSAVIGGEGNGGVIDPRIQYVRDSLAGIAIILEYLATSGKTVSQLAEDIPRYEIRKTKIDCSRDIAFEVMDRLQQVYASQKINTSDGVRVEWDDAWVHVRPSNTEPAMRIIAEARTEQKAIELIEEVEKLARSLV